LKNITSKGIIESDTMISLFVLLFMIYLMFNSLNQIITEEKEKELNYLKSKALFFADSLIKNCNELEPEKGIAFYNPEKKRIEENVIDLSLAEKLNEKNFPEKLKQIRIESAGEKLIVVGEKKADCFEARRFVLIHQTGETGVVFVVSCN